MYIKSDNLSIVSLDFWLFVFQVWRNTIGTPLLIDCFLNLPSFEGESSTNTSTSTKCFLWVKCISSKTNPHLCNQAVVGSTQFFLWAETKISSCPWFFAHSFRTGQSLSEVSITEASGPNSSSKWSSKTYFSVSSSVQNGSHSSQSQLVGIPILSACSG